MQSRFPDLSYGRAEQEAMRSGVRSAANVAIVNCSSWFWGQVIRVFDGVQP